MSAYQGISRRFYQNAWEELRCFSANTNPHNWMNYRVDFGIAILWLSNSHTLKQHQLVTKYCIHSSVCSQFKMKKTLRHRLKSTSKYPFHNPLLHNLAGNKNPQPHVQKKHNPQADVLWNTNPQSKVQKKHKSIVTR